MEYNELHKKFTPMINSITKKYSSYVECDDLYQEAIIAVIEAYDKYDPNKGAKLESFMYNIINWKCLELVEKNKKNKECISLQLLASQDDETTTLQDNIVDNNVDIEADVIDREMYKFYENEIRRVLPKDKAEALINKYFKGYFGVNKYKLWSGKNSLIKRSYVFREEYFKLKGIKVELSLYD